MTAAAAVTEIRRRSGLGLRALARRAGTSHATLRAYETGTKDPRVETMRRIAEAGGFDLHVELAARPEPDAAAGARGQELLDVLELAAQFPARHYARLRAPIFGRSRA